MDSIALVEEREATERLLAEYRKTVPVVSAFWLKRSDGRDWYLCAVTPLAAKEKTYDAAYEALHEAKAKVAKPGDEFSSVWLLEPRDGVARDVEALRQEQPNRRILYLDGRLVGHHWVDQIVFVPPPPA